MPLIKLYCDSGFVGTRRDDEEYIDDDFWATLTTDEREKHLEQMGMDFMWNSGIECGAHLADEDDE